MLFPASKRLHVSLNLIIQHLQSSGVSIPHLNSTPPFTRSNKPASNSIPLSFQSPRRSVRYPRAQHFTLGIEHLDFAVKFYYVILNMTKYFIIDKYG